MTISFKKELELYRLDVYLKIEKKVIRKDFQDYLNGKKFLNPLIENRISDYFKNIGIYENTNIGGLTPKGEELKNTGEKYEYEEGKYSIWYVENDMILGDKILFFKRIPPERKFDNEKRFFEKNFPKEEHFLLPTKNNEFLQFNLINNIKYCDIYPDKYRLNFYWVWEGLEKSYYSFEGKLDDFLIKSERISCKKNLKENIKYLFQNDWDDEYNRFKIDFPDLEDEREKFLCKKEERNLSTYLVKLEDIPIMPKTEEIARKWRDWLLEKRIKKEYLSVKDFEYEAENIREKEGLMKYKNKLGLPNIDDFMGARKIDKLIKWHLQAPKDLNPNKKFLLSSSFVIKFAQGEIFSFREFASKLNPKEGDVIIYCDIYALDHCALVEKFLDEIEVSKKIIVSLPFTKDNNDWLSNSYRRCQSKFKIIDVNQNKDRLHDRYIFILKDNRWYILNGSNSLNSYVNYDKQSKNYKTTKPTVYTYIDQSMFGRSTINFLNKIANE